MRTSAPAGRPRRMSSGRFAPRAPVQGSMHVAVARFGTEAQARRSKMDDIRWFAGVDWASEKHRVCLLNANGQAVGERDVDHTGAGLSELCSWLLEKTGAAPGQIAVAIEVPHGPVVEALLERGFAVYAINPKQLDRFRDRFTVAGAKDDRRDAHVLAAALATDRPPFPPLAPEDARIIELRELSRLDEELGQEGRRLTNRLREQLSRFYIQILQHSPA